MARVALQDYLSEARELINTQAFDEAIAICRHILLRYPKHIRTYQILGEACLEKGETDEAIAVFKRLLEHADPENFSAYAGLGVAYEDLGQLPQAIWYMERAFELAPNNEDARDALKRLYQKRDGIEPDRIRHNKVALARLYARGGQYQQAIQELRQLLESEPAPGRLDLRLSLAEALWRDGRREQAADVTRSILQTTPDCLKAVLILGKILIEKGRRDEGVAVLVRTRALDPENLVAQSLFGEDSPLAPESVLIPRLRQETLAEVVATSENVQPAPGAGAPEAAEIVQQATPASTEPLAEELTKTTEENAPPTPLEEAASDPSAGAAVDAMNLASAQPADQLIEVDVTAAQPTEVDVVAAQLADQPTEADKAAALPADQSTETVEAAPNLPEQQSVEIALTEPTESGEPSQEPEHSGTVAEVMVPSVESDGLLLAPPPAQQPTAPVVPIIEGSESVAELAGTAPLTEPESSPVEPVAEMATEAQPVTTEPVTSQPLAAEPPAPTDLAVSELAAPVLAATSTARRRRKKSAEAPPPLEAMAGVGAGLLSEIERCRQQLEVKPKDDDARLALARAYRDAAQIKLALQEYSTLARGKTKRTAEVVADMEGLVASRPDNLEAHELLADVYAKNGQLQLAMQRYRWVLERMRQPS